MPTSKWVDVDERDQSKPSIKMPGGGRRRSARLRRKTRETSDRMDEGADPDETMLDDDKDETILLSDEEVGGGNEGQPKAEGMDVDVEDTFAAVGGLKGNTPPLNLRGGAGLTSDPLTSSTLKSSQSTTLSEIRKELANKSGRYNAPKPAEKQSQPKNRSAAWGDSDDDDTVDDEEFAREVARRNEERSKLMLEGSFERDERPLQKKGGPRGQQQPSTSSRLDQSLQTQPPPQNESEDTARMANGGAASSHDPSTRGAATLPNESPTLSESFAATQPWERELGALPDAPPPARKDLRPKEGSRMEEGRSHGRREEDASIDRSSTHRQEAPRKSAPRKDARGEAEERSNRRQEAPRKGDGKRDHCRDASNGSLPSHGRNNGHDAGHRREEEYHRNIQERQASSSNGLPGHPGQERESRMRNAPRQDHRARAQLMQEQLEERYDIEPGYNHNDQRRGQEAHHPTDRQEMQLEERYDTEPGYSRQNNQRQNDRRGQEEHHPTERQEMQVGFQAAGAASNPYTRKQPPPPTKRAPCHVPKIALENLRSARKSTKGRSRITKNSSYDNGPMDGSRGDTEGDDETWQEEAFRSSLLDLLGSFPSSYFDGQDEAMDDNEGSLLFATSATEIVDEQSPNSTTSQRAASAQLQRKRLFDAAARALARLAIASRHPSRKGAGDRTGRSSDGQSPDYDFNPPSPRSLPSYMSVMNVHDDSDPGGMGHWGAGNANAILSSSKEVFSGRSVHGRNARTVQLSTVREGNNVPSTNPFAPWTLEELAYGAMVFAGQVCFEASCDPTFEVNSSRGEAESCRVAGFAQNSSSAEGRGKKPVVSSALVESALGFLATAFACLEADFVYSVLKASLKGGSYDASVFDALSHFCPVATQNSTTQEAGTIPALSLLALSRGLEAALYVARYATTLDPSTAFVAYASPHQPCSIGAIDTGIDEGGVGWLSALGRDLGLRLEDNRNSRPRHMHLQEIAAYAYDAILEYNPMVVDDTAESYRGMPGRNESQRRGNSRGGLGIDTQVGQGNQGSTAIASRQPSVVNDRLYAATVEYLSSMIHAGIASGWMSSDPAAEGADANEANGARTVDKLCQKLFFVIETRARLRRSTNQSTSTSDPGDSEAVCAASLSLLILALPKHVVESGPSSLSTSFRQMGNSTGTIEDLLQSPLVRKMVELGLSWHDSLERKTHRRKSDDVLKGHATCNAIHIISDVCMAGGSSLISTHFHQRVEEFLHTVTAAISERGRSGADDDILLSSMESSLMLLLQLHTGCPILVRQFLRDFVDDKSASGFVSGLLCLAASQSFATSSCASSLFRALIDGNPVDRTPDRLSEGMLDALDSEHARSAIESAVRALVDATYSAAHCNVPAFCVRWHPRLCSLGDLLATCTHSFSVVEIFASSLSDEALNLFASAMEVQSTACRDTLGAASKLSILSLFAAFVHNEGGSSVLAHQRHVKETLIRHTSFLPVLESAMAQGTSADLTHRSLKLQNTLMSLTDERTLALTFTKASGATARKESVLRNRLQQIELEKRELASMYHKMESEHDSLNNALHDQRLAYERQLEWTRSEARTSARNVSEIHVHERKLAEEQYQEEKELRVRAEEENEQMKRENTDDKARIRELEALLDQERKSRQHFESSYEECQNELSAKSDELENVLQENDVLNEKLAVAEESVADLTESNEDAVANLEDTSAKLIRLATIYQRKETEMNKYKAELRTAVSTANKQADSAIQKYEVAKQQNKALKAELKEKEDELNEIKAHRADVQRMKKNAPVSYINNLHKDPRIKKKQGGKSRSGKENSFDGR